MKQTELIMGMPITVEVVDRSATRYFSMLFDYFRSVDDRYSTYKPSSEISRINNGLLKAEWSAEMKSVFALCEQTSRDTAGFFNIVHDGKRDPSGLVKGWAIYNAANQLLRRGIKDFYIEAGGDIQAQGHGSDGRPWLVGIRNPFNIQEIIKTLQVTTEGVATSGTYIRGQHIYNPMRPGEVVDEVSSLTVIGSNIYEADRFATAAFAMGKAGIQFIESRQGLEGYMVMTDKMATYTNGFERYVAHV